MDKKLRHKQMLEDINYCNKMINLSYCMYAKQYWINLFNKKMEEALKELEAPETKEENKEETKQETAREPEKQFTLEELAQYDGSMGKAAYIAIEGIVYDVSWNSCWGGGTHFGLLAGKELTAEFKKGHMKGIEVLKELPVVGVLK